MRSFVRVLLVLAFLSPAVSVAESNPWDDIAHRENMAAQMRECGDVELRTGRADDAVACRMNTREAYERLLDLYASQAVPTLGWSLCLSQSSGNGLIYYPLAYICMQYLPKICEPGTNLGYKDATHCARLMMSGAWIQRAMADRAQQEQQQAQQPQTTTKGHKK